MKCLFPFGRKWLPARQYSPSLLAAKLLEEAGYWIPAIRPPTVPLGSARLRITFSANHSMDDVRELIRTLKSIEQKTLEKTVA